MRARGVVLVTAAVTSPSDRSSSWLPKASASHRYPAQQEDKRRHGAMRKIWRRVLASLALAYSRLARARAGGPHFVKIKGGHPKLTMSNDDQHIIQHTYNK